jgi:hypothetical protein
MPLAATLALMGMVLLAAAVVAAAAAGHWCLLALQRRLL